MTTRVEQALELIRVMTILELRDLNKCIETEFGVTAAAPAALAAPTGALAPAAPVEEEKTEWGVRLRTIGENKINVIKAVRELTTLGLKEAKDLVESAPTMVKEAIPKEDAEAAVTKLQAAGAAAELV